jgi:hypothetical protein
MELLGKFVRHVLIYAAVTQASGAPPQYSVTLQAPTAPVKAGSEVRVKATTTNTSDHEIRFAKGFGEEEFDFEIEVRDEKGQAPPLTQPYSQLKEHPASRRGSYSTYVLESGKSFDDDLVLTKLYKITQPGKYTVSVMRGQRPMWQLLDKEAKKNSAKSNTITITLTQ